MMSNSNPVVALARSFATRGQEIDERDDALILGGLFADAAEQASAVALSQAASSPFLSVQVYDPAIGGDVEADEEYDPARIVIITVAKPAVEGTAAFLFAEAAAQYLEAAIPPRLLVCLELEERAAFICRGLKIEPWQLDQSLAAPAAAVAVSPRKLVKDFVPGREVVEDLSPWILASPPAVTSIVYSAWRNQAARRLLGGLTNAALLDDDVVWLQASGPPLFRIAATDANLITGLEQLTRAVEWVYLRGYDVDARHLIFALELARACRLTTPLDEGLRQAIESAQTTYEAHVQSASRETLKALADLRKTIIDETQKVTQRAQDLASGLWRDVAVSAAPFVLKNLGDTAKLSNTGVTAGFYFAAAVFITVSFFLQVRINGSYLANQRQARSKWFETLYAVISPAERKRIAEDPIKQAEKDYRETRCVVGLVYGLLISILVLFGFARLGVGAPQLQSALPNASKSATAVAAPSANLPPTAPPRRAEKRSATELQNGTPQHQK